MTKTSNTLEYKNIGTTMDDVENKTTDMNSDKTPITEHQDIDHYCNAVNKISNLSASNRSVGSTSAQETLTQ